ncbi:MAG: SRPBCC family protein [Bacteroidales bacterium]
MQTHHKISVKTIVDAPFDKVWDALTKPDLVKQYFFGTELLTDWTVGGPIVFQGEWEGQAYKDSGEVLEYEHNRKLAYSYLSTWSGKEDKPENYLWVSYEVKPGGNKTEVTIQQSNYDVERAKHSEESWSTMLEALKKTVEQM